MAGCPEELGRPDRVDSPGLEAKRAKHDLKAAQRDAEMAERDAEFAIDYAYWAIEEAEYAVLDATLADERRQYAASPS